MKRLFLLASLLTACSRADDRPLPGASTDTVVAVPVATDTLAPASEGPTSDTPGSVSKSCGVTGTPILSEKGIGELKQGRPVNEVAGLCEILSDSRQQGQEGMMERVVVVRIAGETLRAIVTDDRIFRIEVTTPRFRTTDSLGVDTPLRRIASMRGAQFAPGEDGVYGFSPEHCGLSFRFSLPWRPPAGGQWTAQAIAQRHGDAAVNRVIVIECRR